MITLCGGDPRWTESVCSMEVVDFNSPLGRHLVAETGWLLGQQRVLLWVTAVVRGCH